MDFRTWMRQAGSHRLLTAAEEVELAKRVERGDVTARNALVEHNVRLAFKIAYRFRGHGVEMEDLLQESLIGLQRAAEKFDWRKGFRFTTYASWWLAQAASRAVENQSRTVRLPAHVHQELLRIDRADRRLMTDRGHEPSNAELAAATGLSEERVAERLAARRQQPASLDAPVKGSHDDSDSTALSEVVADTKSPSPHAVASERAMSETLKAALAELPYRQRRVLIARWGLDGSEPQTLEQLSLTFGTRDANGVVIKPLQKERIRQLEHAALDFLRQHHARELLSFLNERQDLAA